MFKKTIWSLFALLIVQSTSKVTWAQARGEGRPAPPNIPGTFTFIPKADLEAVMGPTRGDPASESRECQRRGQYGRIHPALSAPQESDAGCQVPPHGNRLTKFSD